MSSIAHQTYRFAWHQQIFRDRDYELADFVARSQIALNIASDRVYAKYGRACGLALGQLAEIEATALQFGSQSRPIVRVIKFIE